jgi:hypothetical protein
MPKWEDLDDLLKLINSLVEEGAEIIRNEKDEIFFVVEVDEKVITSSETRPL